MEEEPVFRVERYMDGKGMIKTRAVPCDAITIVNKLSYKERYLLTRVRLPEQLEDALSYLSEKIEDLSKSAGPVVAKQVCSNIVDFFKAQEY